MLAELASLARQSDDAALALEVARDALRPEFDLVFARRTAEDMIRAKELYIHVIARESDAKRLRREAALFRAVIGLMDETVASTAQPLDVIGDVVQRYRDAPPPSRLIAKEIIDALICHGFRLVAFDAQGVV